MRTGGLSPLLVFHAPAASLARSRAIALRTVAAYHLPPRAVATLASSSAWLLDVASKIAANSLCRKPIKYPNLRLTRLYSDLRLVNI